MVEEVRKKLVKQILKKGVDIGNKDPVVKQLVKDSEGETFLFLVDDLKAPYGFIVCSDKLEFMENPDLNQPYDLIATCNENTFVHMLKGEDPENLFWMGALEMSGHGWFKRAMLIRRFLKVGVNRGLRKKVIGL
ncbi:hypothetical protein KKF45_05390 [Patescibacteria group bacterium]|nr:hypothetical protein [Patescibacteria group bacterium]